MTLILVTGLPCTGKTTVARALATALALPLFTKDTFKEQLFDRLGVRDAAWSKQLSQAAFDLLFLAGEAELAVGRSVVLEGNFDRACEGERYEALRAKHTASAVQVVLSTEEGELVRRFRVRAEAGERHPGHDDAAYLPVLAERARGGCAPLALEGEVLEVDTTDLGALDLGALVARVRACL